MVVIWRSPGIEEVDKVVKDEPGPTVDSKELAFKVIQPSEIEAGTQLEQIVAAVQDELPRLPEDGQVLAQALRRRLTADFGTVWHVVAGTDFVIEAAEDRRNFLMVSIGKLRVVCFQHEQFMGSGGLLSMIDWNKILQSIPYFLMIVLCFLYMTLTNLCQEGRGEVKLQIGKRLQAYMCSDDWENNLGMLGACVLGSSFCMRKVRLMRDAQNKKAR
ncbi:unnamed protein product [Polarella glacialis]|uniref:Uncharacterized protein n=1 Tax=Polarella glacialis TaxID=89957 RepID=A0A813HJV0_POLGL|nr:unnamed protein product [Polarella glacialis]